ncbi:hypothetical protein [Paraburkholderia hospita]|uniref:hypothetical protein n=1 Tax=Paraburkholderia hospita TaxID=169430 RepID=UPI001055CC0B|nr:hypothetical protein [Paraburkholderia hospita]
MANTAIHAIALIFMTIVTLWWSGRSRIHARSRFRHSPDLPVAMILLFAASALFHGLPAGCLNRLFMKLDYCAILHRP